MMLFGGPGDGAEVRVSGAPLPEFVTWSQASPSHHPMIEQHASRPVVSSAALYVLNRADLRYVFESPKVS